MRLLIAGSPSKFFHLQEFGNELVRKGHEIKLVIDTDVYEGFPSRKFSSWFDNKEKFKKLITDFSPDAIFVDRQTNFGKITIEENIPLYVHLRGDFWAESKMAKQTLYKYPPKRSVIWFKERTANKCFDGATKIFPICDYLNRVVTKHHPGKQVHTMYQGISADNWFETEGMKLKHPCVGLLQSAVILEKTKELLTLTRALEKMPDVTFYWVGDGPYRDMVLPILKKYKNFKWLGSLEYPDKVRDFLTEIDVYALLSGIDMSPLTLQEAQLMKKPVIATNVGGIPELMKKNESGLLIEKSNPTDFIDKLEIILSDLSKAKSMGEKGREFVSKTFSWDAITSKFLDDIKIKTS